MRVRRHRLFLNSKLFLGLFQFWLLVGHCWKFAPCTNSKLSLNPFHSTKIGSKDTSLLFSFQMSEIFQVKWKEVGLLLGVSCAYIIEEHKEPFFHLCFTKFLSWSTFESRKLLSRYKLLIQRKLSAKTMGLQLKPAN